MPVQRRRREANGKAAEILGSGRPISDADVLAVLSLWRFRKNSSRLNVLPSGTDFVSSDTLGLVCDRKGTVLVDSGTRKWPSVLRLLATWLKHRKPAALEMDFPFTSISVNHNYSARLHRDGHNAGVFLYRSDNDGHQNCEPSDNTLHVRPVKIRRGSHPLLSAYGG